ncbi:MAG TPA: DUF262 domain-containing protein [Abditibacteriaceae bacterium]|jgi:hypothetical protein
MSKLKNPAKPVRAISESDKAKAEEQIISNLRVVDYDTKEYPVEVIVNKYLEGLEDDENEFFIPDYQRDFVWDTRRQSKFIESILIGLPIPFFFVADVTNKEGRLEIVDGSQRVRTLAAFLTNALVLEGLEKLDKLNGFKFDDLTLARQRRFKGRSLRTIALSEKADEEIRRDLFERINTGSAMLNDMEKRRGIRPGPFLDLVQECAEDSLFRELAPLSEASAKRFEYGEFVLRFFAYLDRYQKFDRSVVDFLNTYLNGTQKGFTVAEGKKMRKEFESMLKFVQKHFSNGFAKGTGHTRTPRIRFEAIAVGTALALRENPRLVPPPTDWVNGDVFRELTTSDASNSRPKVIKRIEYVRDQLLGK